jgi:hypothetical protein
VRVCMHNIITYLNLGASLTVLGGVNPQYQQQCGRRSLERNNISIRVERIERIEIERCRENKGLTVKKKSERGGRGACCWSFNSNLYQSRRNKGK